MKRIFSFVAMVVVSFLSNAQNVGIGTTEPVNKLQVQGNLLVTTPTISTNTAPSVSQTKTIINAGTITFSATDSTGRIYDPGGPTGTYNANITGNAQILSLLSSTGIELTIETIQLGTGDSLIVKESFTGPDYLLAVGNGYTSTGKWLFNSPQLYIIFKSNTDANVGSGFSLLFRRMYVNNSSLPEATGHIGKSFYFDVKTGVLRSGDHTNANRGTFSTALGFNNTASGDYSIAMGTNTEASGQTASTMGSGTTALGLGSTAMGFNTTALANFSTATGNATLTEGRSSTAMGWGTTIRSEAGMVIGMYNDPILTAPQVSVTSTTPLFIIGNGNGATTLNNAMVVLKNGNVGIGADAPAANLHIRHTSGGGLLLENANDGNKWRIYSASGDNHLTFYNNAGTEIADIDDATGTFNALSDMRFKKNIQVMKPVLPLLMQLRPAYYRFNWQHQTEQQQIGMLAQEAHKLFPELVSYNKTNDVYKMNYAGFSTVAIKAIQEQQGVIENLQKQVDELKVLVNQLMKNK